MLAFGDSSVRICSQLWSKKVVPERVGDRGPEAETRLGLFLSLRFPVTDFSGFSSLFSSCLSWNLVGSSALGLQTVHLFSSGPFLSSHLLSPGISTVGMEGITKISCFYENQLGHFLPFFFCLTLFFFPGIPFPFYILEKNSSSLDSSLAQSSLPSRSFCRSPQSELLFCLLLPIQQEHSMFALKYFLYTCLPKVSDPVQTGAMLYPPSQIQPLVISSLLPYCVEYLFTQINQCLAQFCNPHLLPVFLLFHEGESHAGACSQVRSLGFTLNLKNHIVQVKRTINRATNNCPRESSS